MSLGSWYVNDWVRAEGKVLTSNVFVFIELGECALGVVCFRIFLNVCVIDIVIWVKDTSLLCSQWRENRGDRHFIERRSQPQCQRCMCVIWNVI